MLERDIFLQARQILDPTERNLFLERACEGQETIRSTIDDLLARESHLGTFLEDDAPPIGTHEISDKEMIGRMVGPYRLLAVLGEGGIGVVYLAEQLHPVSRRVAVKVVKPGMDSRQVIARFEAERQALALMDHPNIAKVLDAGESDDGHPYFVMELVQGARITAFCDTERLDVRQRLSLFLPVCHAVQHAHQKGVIHRDLKPSNVLIGIIDGQAIAKVIDFGVAKATHHRLTEKTMLTELGQLIGTPQYMSPEQAELGQLDIDTRSDVYGLGALLYELLTGVPPFDLRATNAGIHELLRRIKEEEPPRPSHRWANRAERLEVAALRRTTPLSLASMLRGDLDWIVMKSLEKERELRYATVTGLAADIERHLRDEPVHARSPSFIYRTRKYVRRNWRSLAAACAVAILLSAGAIGTSAALVRSAWDRAATATAEQNAKQSAGLAKASQESEKRAQVALARAVAAEREVQFAAHLSQARNHRLSQGPGQSVLCLEEIRAAAKQLQSKEQQRQLRNEMIAALLLVDVRPAATLDCINHNANPTLSDDFSKYAERNEQGAILVRSVADGKTLREIPANYGNRPVMEFTRDGTKLICFNDVKNESALWDLAEGRELWRVDGQLRATANGEVFWTWEFSTGDIAVRNSRGAELRRFKVGGGWHAFATDPTEKLLAVTHNEGPLAIWNLETGKLEKEIPELYGTGLVAWDPHGRFLAVFRERPNVLAVWDLEYARFQSRSRSIQTVGSSIRFYPRGDFVLTDGWDNTLRVWNVWTGEQELSIPGSQGGHVAFSNDGNFLGSTRQGERAQIWQLYLPTPFRRCLGLPRDWERVENLELSSDGSLLLMDRQLVDVRHGTVLPMASIVHSVTFSDDSFLAATSVGLLKIPLHEATRATENRSPNFAIGPPKLVGPPTAIEGVRAVAGSNIVLVCENLQKNSTLAMDIQEPSKAKRLPIQWGNTAIDRNGRWVATAPFKSTDLGERVEIWDATTGEHAASLPLISHQGTIRIAFSSNNDWLVTSTFSEYRVWKTGTWEAGPKLSRERGGVWPGPISLAGKQPWMASVTSMRHVKLVDVRDMSELFTLDMGNQDNVGLGGAVALSQDGSTLAIGSKVQSLDVLHLPSIRRELAKVGIDWHSENDSPSTDNVHLANDGTNGQSARIAQIDWGTWKGGASPQELADSYRARTKADPDNVDIYFEWSQAHFKNRDFRNSLTACVEGLKRQPDHPALLGWAAVMAASVDRPDEAIRYARRLMGIEATPSREKDIASWCNNVCANLVFGVTPANRRPDLAVELGQRAIALAPENWVYHLTLGIAYTRAARYDDGVREMTLYREKAPGDFYSHFGLFFSALAQIHLGHAKEAERDLGLGNKWLADHPSVANDPPINEVKEEIEKLLGGSEPTAAPSP